jgi:hypothetical protein
LRKAKARKKAKTSINGLCDKPLEKLPVSKDLPRLARNFEVFVPDDDADIRLARVQSFKEVKDWKANTKLNFVPDPDDDPNEIPKNILLYQLLQALAQNLPKHDRQKIFPTYEEYEKSVNLDDPTSLNNFLLEQFGEEHEVIRLLKVCHQSVIVNILLGARHALTKHHVQFKDVRGAWRIQVHVPSGQQYDMQDDTSTDDSETDPYLLDLERLKSRYISLGHRRREQVFVTFAEWKKQQELVTGEPLPPQKNHSAMKQLFQFEWEVRIFFDPKTFALEDVAVQLLGINYNNEDGTKSSERDCAIQRNALIDFFQQYVTTQDEEEEEEDVKTPTNASPVVAVSPSGKTASPVQPTETTALTNANSSSQGLGFTNLLFRLLCWRRRNSQI